MLNFPNIVTQTAFQRLIILRGFIQMILVKIFKFKYILSQVKVIPQKQHQISHELLIVEDHALQHV